jgi:hypothetical protein
MSCASMTMRTTTAYAAVGAVPSMETEMKGVQKCAMRAAEKANIATALEVAVVETIARTVAIPAAAVIEAAAADTASTAVTAAKTAKKMVGPGSILSGIFLVFFCSSSSSSSSSGRVS